MSIGFWRELPKPIIGLAPLANVTDAAFRRVIAKYGKFTRPDGTRGGGPDVMFTEFVSADGLMSAGRENLLVDLLYSKSERPIVAQLFSGNPEKMYEAAGIVKELGFDGLDINMGCPDRSIEKSGAGAALIKNPRLAREIIRAAKEGVATPPKVPPLNPPERLFSRAGRGEGDRRDIPVSIKTRLGYNTDILDEWLPELLAEEPAAITIHARTRKEMSKVPAHWDRIRDAVAIRDSFFSSSPPLQRGRMRGGGDTTLIFGNGDVASIAEAHQKAKETGADGILLGRAIFGNPWLFANLAHAQRDGQIEHPPKLYAKADSPIAPKLKVMVEHALLFEELLGKHKSFSIMKKHFKPYVQDFEGAKELRMKLMGTENVAQAEKIVADFLKTQ